MQLHSLMPYLLYQFKNEHELIKAIEELSLKFTQKRERLSDYLKDERLTSAYTAFYLTTNMPKLEAVFQWMPGEWLEKLKNCTLIDLGAGPGTFSLAFREWLGHSTEVIQIETSTLMREQAKKIWEGLYPNEPLVQAINSRITPHKEKFLLLGHSANEMGAELVSRYINEIEPDHILFIEPGTKTFFPEMLKIRSLLLSQNYNVLYPCPNASDCPLKGSDEDWCHQFIQVKQDPELERLSQMAKKDRSLLPLIVHAYSKKIKSKNAEVRLIRVLPETKFSFEWQTCELNKAEHYQIMKRGLDKPSLNALEKTLAGAPVFVEVVEKMMENRKRVKIKLTAKS